MERPLVEANYTERELGNNEITDLPCTSTVRNIASGYDGIIMESEKVTHDERLGYIYRYNIVNFGVDDGSFHPELGTKGTTYKVETKLVVHTLDCINFRATTYPMFELPNPRL